MKKRQFDDDVQDVRDHASRGGCGPEFRDIEDLNGLVVSTNAHDERDYEDMTRMKPQITHAVGHDGQLRAFKTDPPMSVRVKNQALNSHAARVGAMTFDSVLDHSRGYGDMDYHGGTQERAKMRPGDLWLGKHKVGDE